MLFLIDCNWKAIQLNPVKAQNRVIEFCKSELRGIAFKPSYRIYASY
jgi:hypothetical protein